MGWGCWNGDWDWDKIEGELMRDWNGVRVVGWAGGYQALIVISYNYFHEAYSEN